jgi:uncharacterized protein YkwD
MRAQQRSFVRLILLACASPLLIGSLGPRTNFDDRLLAAHNRERLSVAVPPLQWDARLAAGAGEWADHLSRSGKFEHSPDLPGQEPEGENIWGGTPQRYLPESMVGLWIAEKRFYKPGTFPANSRSGRLQDVTHYTQVIWRRTTHVGCGARISGSEEILVCRYRTAGNIYGQAVL